MPHLNRLKLPLLDDLLLDEILDVVANRVVGHGLGVQVPHLLLLVVVLPVVPPVQPHMPVQSRDVFEPTGADSALDHVGVLVLVPGGDTTATAAYRFQPAITVNIVMLLVSDILLEDCKTLRLNLDWRFVFVYPEFC